MWELITDGFIYFLTIVLFLGMIGSIFSSLILITSIPTLYKKVKSGTSLRTAIKELLSDTMQNRGGYQHNFPTHSVDYGSSSIPQLQDINTSSSYVGLPNNIFTSRSQY